MSDDANRTRNFGGAREPGYGSGKSHGFRFMEIISLLRKHLHMQENMLQKAVSFTIMITTNIGIIREIEWLKCVHPYTIRVYLMCGNAVSY